MQLVFGQVVDACGSDPAAAGWKGKAEGIGAVFVMQGSPDTDPVCSVFIPDKQCMGQVRPFLGPLVAEYAGYPPGPGLGR